MLAEYIEVSRTSDSIVTSETLAADVDSTRTKLESGDEAQLATLTKHDLVGDLIHGTAFQLA